MSLIRPMSEIREQLERIFADLTDDFTYTVPREWRPYHLLKDTGKTAWLPAIEVSETESDYIIKAEVPGIKPEDMSVEILGSVVTIQGVTRQERKTEKHNVHRSEFRYCEFYRQIPLPNNIKSENCRAEFNHGILQLTLPKVEESKHQRLKIDIKTQS